MRPRDILLLLALTGLAAAFAAIAFGFGARAAEPAPAGFGATEDLPLDVPAATEPRALELETADMRSQAERRIDAGASSDFDDLGGPAPTAGVIEGTVSMPTDLLGRVTSYRIRTVELMGTSGDRLSSPQPFDRIWNAFAIPYDHTPRFRIEGVPFSSYGYRVELLAKHCNGGSAIARVTTDSPFAEVRLAITKPVTFTMRLQDQHMNAHAKWHVQLRPTGNPIGRTQHSGETDRFGTALFQDVVAGDYEVWREGNQLGVVHVAPITFPRRGQPIRVQSATLVVPAGRELRVEIFSPGGFGLADVTLELQKTDTTRNLRFVGVTDHGGIHTFEYLEQGRYQLDVIRDGYQRTTRTVQLEEAAASTPLQIRLASTR